MFPAAPAAVALNAFANGICVADTGIANDTTDYVQTTAIGRDTSLNLIDRAVDEFRMTCALTPVTSTGTSPPWPSLLPSLSTPSKRDANPAVQKSHSQGHLEVLPT